VQYNKFLKDRHNNAFSCAGGGFLPALTNRTLGHLLSNGASFNCHLQYNSQGIILNDHQDSGLGVVALCLDGMCDVVGIM
jgi:hypothetical protein